MMVWIKTNVGLVIYNDIQYTPDTESHIRSHCTIISDDTWY